MEMRRFVKHLLTPGWWVRRAFRWPDRQAIRNAVATSELSHRGEIRFAAEGPLPLSNLLSGQTTRARATQLFDMLGVGNTREASGVLIYVQLVDRRVEILADHGIADRIAPTEWERICREMEVAFAQGDWRRGALEAIERTTQLLTVHFPGRPGNPNELEDSPRFF
ncbi:MAG: TPM domain-containing protein [Gammaproteobacteria bacterium]|nr:TPM domain-containing protein [Gammaproteobacteria bacterium]MBU1414834.1 TPM domain-containing protein [Gammaproteobacteria bacterium]